MTLTVAQVQRYELVRAAGDIVSCRRESDDVVYYQYDTGRMGSHSPWQNGRGVLQRTAPAVRSGVTGETWKDSGGSTIYGFTWDYGRMDGAIRLGRTRRRRVLQPASRTAARPLCQGSPAGLPGNRTYQSKDLAGAVTETYYTYDAANALARSHEVPADEWTYYGYDKNGSLVALQAPAGTTYFTYADHGLTESITPPTGDPVYFYYDGRLTRYAMKQGADVTYFCWDGLNILQTVKNGTTTRMTYGHSVVAGNGAIVEEQRGDSRRYHHMNQVGTTYEITDENGDVIWSGETNAFGEELAKPGDSPSIFWFQGQAWYRVILGGNTYFVSPTRFYDPTLANFATPDPLVALAAKGEPLAAIAFSGVLISFYEHYARTHEVSAAFPPLSRPPTAYSGRQSSGRPVPLGRIPGSPHREVLAMIDKTAALVSGVLAAVDAQDSEQPDLPVERALLLVALREVNQRGRYRFRPRPEFIDPTGLGFVDCAKWISILTARQARAARDFASNVDWLRDHDVIDRGHLRKKRQVADSLQEAVDKVFKHCIKPCEEAAAEAARKVVTQLEDQINAFTRALTAGDWAGAAGAALAISALVALLIATAIPGIPPPP